MFSGFPPNVAVDMRSSDYYGKPYQNSYNKSIVHYSFNFFNTPRVSGDTGQFVHSVDRTHLSKVGALPRQCENT